MTSEAPESRCSGVPLDMQTFSIPLPSPRLGSGGGAMTRSPGVRLGVTRVQPPCPAPSRDSPEGGCSMRPDTELKGSLRLIRPWVRPQLFITSAEHSASALARA